MDVHTSCTNNVNKNIYGICWVLLIVNCMQYCSLFKDGIGGAGGRTLMVGEHHHDSLSGTLYGCATPPVQISGSS